MKKIIVILFFGLLIAQNNEINSLSEHLKPFERYLGKTFKGEFSIDKMVFNALSYCSNSTNKIANLKFDNGVIRASE